jgi:hypothetical protein
MNFAVAYEALAIGQRVRVSNGQPAPAGGVEFNIWKSHNHEGEVVSKQGGAFRTIRVQLDEAEGVQVAYDVAEASSDIFEPV